MPAGLPAGEGMEAARASTPASAGRRKKASVKRSYYWESLDDALQGKTDNALTASQLSRGRRYYSDGGARAVRLDDDTVHIEHRGIGRAQSSGVLPLHQLTPSRAPPPTMRLANITNTAPTGAVVASTPEASPALVCIEKDFSALASSRRVSFTPPRPSEGQLEPDAVPPPPRAIVRNAPSRSGPDVNTLALQLAQKEEACRALRARLVTVERERTADRKSHDTNLQAQQAAHSRALQVLEARHAKHLALVARRADAVLRDSVTDSVVQDTLALALEGAVDDAAHFQPRKAHQVTACALVQCDMDSSDAAQARAMGQVAAEQTARITDLESQLDQSERKLALAVATCDALRQQGTDDSVRSAALQEKLYSTEVALQACETQLVAERNQSQLQRQQFKHGMSAAHQQMRKLLHQHETRVVKNMKKMESQIDGWQSRLDAAEASLCVTQAALTSAASEHAKTLAQLAEEHSSELELVEAQASAQASAAKAATLAQLHAVEQAESNASMEAALRNKMDEQLQAHEQQCAVVAEATEEVLSTMEAQLAHAIATEGELEYSVAARLAEVQAERDTAVLFAEDVEQSRDEAMAALEQAHQEALEVTRMGVDTGASLCMGDQSALSAEEECELREELASQRAAISKGNGLLRKLGEQVEVLLLTLENQQKAATISSTFGPELDACMSSAWASENPSAGMEDATDQDQAEHFAKHPATLIETTSTGEAVDEVGKHLVFETLGTTVAAVTTDIGLVAAPLPQSQHHLSQRTPPKPEPPLEPSMVDAKLAQGKASLRRCNAKFQALLERKQRGL